MIDFQGRHTCVVGRTRQGKTYTVSRLLLKEKAGVLFFNTGLESLPHFVRANGKTDIETLLEALDDGQKINFEPHINHTVAKGQLAAIITALFDVRQHNIYIVVDEAWEYTDVALSAMRKVARRGLKWGLQLIVLVQRLANLSNDLMTQCDLKVIFALNDEEIYFRRYGLPYDDFMRRIASAGKYSYCTYSDAETKGAFKL